MFSEKANSKEQRPAMGAALAIALSLALVFTLLSVILADLLCSLLCRRKHRFERAAPNTSDAGAAAEAEEDPPTPPLSFPFYAHGVLQAPTTFLLTIPNLEAATAAAAAALPPKQVQCKSRMVLTVEHESPSVPASPCIHRISSAAVDPAAPDHFVCISNPIYNGIGGGDDKGTPFETPDASPSHLGPDPEEETESDYSPQLTVMKKLPSVPPQALSAAGLMEGRRSLPTSASATETNRVSSSSSSYSLRCSPSW